MTEYCFVIVADPDDATHIICIEDAIDPRTGEILAREGETWTFDNFMFGVLDRAKNMFEDSYTDYFSFVKLEKRLNEAE